MNIRKNNSLRAVSRAAVAVIIVVIIIIAAAGGYFALSQQKGTTTTSSSSSSSSSATQTTTSTSSTGSATQTTSTGSTSSSSSSTTTSSASSQNVPNPGKIVYETSNQPSSVDPALWSDAGSATIQFNVYETLMQYQGNVSSQVVPWLASNYTVSSDGLTYTVNLRQGITFQDGSPFNATAVVFSFNRVILMDSSSSNVWILVGSQAPGLINGSFGYSHNFGSGAATYNQSQVNAYMSSNGVVAGANPYQVVFHLGYADASFPYLLALTVASIVSPDYVISHWTAPTDGHGYITGVSAGETDHFMNSHMSGTGPYQLKSWDNTTGDVVLTANTNYWGSPGKTGVAKVGEVDLNFVQSDSARVLDLKSGAADISDIPTSDNFAFIDKTTWLSTHQVKVTASGVSVYGPFPQLNIEYIGMVYKIYNPDGSLSSFQPFENKNFRLAIADAVNVTDIVQNAASGFGVQANSPVPPGLGGYNSSVPIYYNYNLNNSMGNLTLAAKALGFNSSNPKTLTMVYAIGDSTGQAVSTALANTINNMQQGITIQVAPEPIGQFLGGVVAKTIPMFVLQYLADYPETTDFLSAFGSATSNVGFFVGYNDTHVTSLINQQASESNATLRAQLINQAEIAMNQDVPYVWLYYPSIFGETGQMFRSYVSGFQFNAAYSGLYFYELSK
ncbi:MAG TPA: ABC transporter substrate-binding protein [Nitrososphaerales archaeon]|nr:ABC transporter substrate-binding protein [Nitrososphaerales archaeon]